MKLQPFGKKALRFILTPVGQDSRITILEGSVRSGKTVAMIPKLIAMCNEPPRGLGVITGVSKDTIYDNILRDLFDVVGTRNYHYNRQSGELDLFGDEWKVIGAKDEGSEKYIRGKTIARAYCDELSLMPERFFKQLLNRMSVPGARLYATTNPDTPMHYLYREYITDKDKIDSGMVKVIHFELDDNPALDEEYKSFIRNAYCGVFYERFILGKWVVAEGAIYKDCWSNDLLYDEETIPIGLRNGYIDRTISIDYGTSNATIFGEYLDDGETSWKDREYYWDSRKEGRQKTDSEYANDLIEFIGPKDDATIILDPSAASFAAELRSRGLVVNDADNEVLDGIRVVSTVLKRKMLRIHRRCVNTCEEMSAYRWDEKAALRGVEQPIKEKDHAPDELRYYCKTKFPQWRLVL